MAQASRSATPVRKRHRRIGFITGRPDVGATQKRLAGYRDAMTAAGIPVDPALVVEGDFQAPRAVAATQQLLALHERPTAVIASSDVVAFGVLRAARDAGLDEPRDLSVVGFDDIREAAHLGAGLTTVRQPLEEMGRVAVERLMSLLQDPSQRPRRVVLDTELIVRQTTAPPPRGRSRGRSA